MRQTWKKAIVAILVAILALFLLGFFGFVVCVLLGCLPFAFFHYRYVRQEELLHVLQTAAAADAPLAPSLWAYVSDRPHSTWREFMVSILLFPVYYWSWHRWYSYDRKVEQLALILEGGAPLHLALKEVPGVAAPETVLAAAVGQASGQLAPCLKQVSRWQLATLWLEVIPRLIYPILLFVTGNTIILFLMVFIVPKMEKIFADFKVKLPPLTEHMIAGVRWLLRYEWLVGLGILALIVLIIVMVCSSTVCWHFPFFGRLYRMHAQARVLKALAILMDTGKPIPQALNLLLESGYFSGTVQNRLETVRNDVEQGQSLAESLYRHGLLPRSMIPLLQAAGRANNVPWALGELGESHAKRVFRLARHLTMCMFPVAIVAMGLGIAAVALGMFLPLVELISELPV
jgi:type II secretory pathway component PulF